MSKSNSHSRKWPQWTLFFAFWTLVGLSFASEFYLANAHGVTSVPWNRALSIYLEDWYVFALLSIPAVALSRKFPFAKGRRGWTALLHAVASALFSCSYILIRAWLGQLHSWWTSAPITLFQAVHLLGKTFLYNVWLYWVILAVSHAFDFYKKFHERELRASELETSLAQARLRALQSQLNPHFLFNTLHSISALMHKDVETADQMIMKLSDLLRLALDNIEIHEVPLAQEIDFLRRYLEIEKTRFRDRLSVDLEIAPETLGALVPNLLLQPLVENALRHGIERHARQGVITLRALREDTRLRLEVQDNGDGLASVPPAREGIGLTNTRNRLEELYGARQSFELQNAPAGGLLARVIIPYRTV
jgi:two-component sensor histidine kinase